MIRDDQPSGPGEILAQGKPPRGFGQLGRARRHPLVRRILVAVLVVGGLAALVVSVLPDLRPPSLVAVTRAPVTGVSIALLTTAAPRGANPIVATYRIGRVQPGVRFSVTGVSGPFIRTSAVRPSEGSDSVTVTATPDCDSAASLGPAPAPYLLGISEQEEGGRSIGGRVEMRASPVDWAAVVQRDCWQAFAANQLAVVGLRATPNQVARRVVLQVVLRNHADRGLRVRVLDIADVATVDAADSGVLGPGRQRAFRVRLPLLGCTSQGAQQVTTLAWSVGPADGDPLALLTIGISGSQRALIRAAAAQLCPP